MRYGYDFNTARRLAKDYAIGIFGDATVSEIVNGLRKAVGVREDLIKGRVNRRRESHSSIMASNCVSLKRFVEFLASSV
jgi:hypothetical protein